MVAAARWETPYAPEWLAYHRAIGFDHVYLTCNDDDPAALWEAVLPFTAGSDPFVTFIHHPWRGQRVHMALRGLDQARRSHPWTLILDLDEFVHLPATHDIERLLDAAETTWGAIHLNRIAFGNSGFRTRPPGGILRTFVRRQPDLTQVSRVLLRSDRLSLETAADGAPVWTDPTSILSPGACQVNVLGEPVPPPPRPRIEPAQASRLMQHGLVHHYPFKSEQDFLLRVARGVQGDFAGQALWKDLHATDQHRAVLAELNAVEDRALADFWAERISQAARRATILPPPPWPNMALQKPARQSSVSPFSRGADPSQDAAGLVNGTISGSFQCHTAKEDRPWWSSISAPQQRYGKFACSIAATTGLWRRASAPAPSPPRPMDRTG